MSHQSHFGSSRVSVLVALALIFLPLSLSFAQSVSSSIQGTVTDPSGAVVPNASVELRDQGTGAVHTATTTQSGLYAFPDLGASTYQVTVHATGFKETVVKDIVLTAAEQRAVPVALELGSASETVAVTAAATPVQTTSSEKASLIDTNQIETVPLKGRDIFGFMNLLPGVVDTANRDVTSPNGLSNITINGNTTSKNFTVDGVTDMDTSGDATVHFEPNMDSVQELKVLGSNFQAEFGRNAGGGIALITKSGTQQFHGSGWWYHRNESMNANDFFRNQSGLSRLPYRYNVEGWSLGGPAFIPKVFNKSRQKFFFFASQEYTGQKNGAATSIGVPAATQFRSVPTALERLGDFSQSVNGGGALIPIVDPNAATPNTNFMSEPGMLGQVSAAGTRCTALGTASCNWIPAARSDPIGSTILNIMPLPNYFPALGNPNFRQDNYTASSVAPHPRRNDVIRGDVYLTSKLSGYFRWIHDYDDTQQIPFFFYPYTTTATGKSAPLTDHPNPGHGYAASATYTITPTLIDDFTFGKSYNQWAWNPIDPNSLLVRTAVGVEQGQTQLPFLYTHNFSLTNPDGERNYIPNVTFGGSTPPNPATFQIGMGNYVNSNDIWSFADNLSKLWGKHSIKAGFYYERTYKVQPPQGGQNTNGTLNFTPDANNSLNSGDSYANALLGYADSYSETSIRVVENMQIQLFEFYIQDNWRATKRLTFDFGVRFYHHSPMVDLNNAIGIFNPALYSAASAPRLYVQGCAVTVATGKTCPATSRRAVDPLTGAQAAFGYVGAFVPGSGNPANGMFQPGANGTSRAFYHQDAIVAAPRVGFALDVFGDGKMAIRGGYGVFYNTLTLNALGLATAQGLPPVGYTANLSYTPISAIQAGQGVNAPVSAPYSVGNYPFDYSENVSFSVQRSLGFSTVLDVSYVGDWGRHLTLTDNLNPVPLGADFNLNTLTGLGSTQNSGSLLRPNYPGMLNVNQLRFLGHTNYNSLQTTLNHRFTHGLQFGASYTFSKALGTTSFDPLVPNNDARNYGPLSSDRRHVLAINYRYNLPNAGKILNNRILGVFTDNWTLSGIATYSTGAPVSPSCTSSTGADITGSTNETPRCQILGNTLGAPPVAGQKFNTAVFALPPVNQGLGSIGNAGLNYLYGPGFQNYDATITKKIPVAGEKRGFELGLQAFNVFNHTEFSTWGISAAFNATGQNTTASFGYPTAARPARILATSLRFDF